MKQKLSKTIFTIFLFGMGVSTYATSYTVVVHGTRPIEFIDKNVPIAHNFCTVKQGLHKLCDVPSKYQLAKALPKLSAADSKNFPAEHMYTFGWCGELSPAARKKTAEELYDALKALRKKMKRGDTLTVITHSHGGNVALNLAPVEDQKKQKLVIDHLVLLAVPVQERTAPLIKHSMFKEITSLYSEGDVVQVLDLQGLHKKKKQPVKKKSTGKKPLFSGRKFSAQKNLTQVRIRSKGRNILHSEFICVPFLKKLPAVLRKIRGKQSDWQGSTLDHLVDICHLDRV